MAISKLEAAYRCYILFGSSLHILYDLRNHLKETGGNPTLEADIQMLEDGLELGNLNISFIVDEILQEAEDYLKSRHERPDLLRRLDQLRRCGAKMVKDLQRDSKTRQ